MASHSSDGWEPRRIAVLPAELADQIAAGEVVERPASVIRELVENAIDAGARRIEVVLHGGGLDRIVVVDDGTGIHADDLTLAVTRHATSKVRSAADLTEIATLGFRGEALASTAAVAEVTLESRPTDQPSGMRLRVRPGWAPQREPVAMAPGTRVEVARLFANVPARRKFMRAEATEVGHCSEAVLRIGLVHPELHLRLCHGDRELLALRPGTQDERVGAVLRRRGCNAVRRVAGAHESTAISAWLGEAGAAVRGGHGVFVVVRRRVVRERSLARIVGETYGDALVGGRQPVACIWVDPPVGEVDVNVHPQKAEVRFEDPQRVYRAARAVLEAARIPAEAHPRVLPSSITAALEASEAAGRYVPDRGAASYALRTRATQADYRGARDQLRIAAHELQADPPLGVAQDNPLASNEALPAEDAPALLTCLPGPVAVLRAGDALLVVDLRAVRSFRLHRLLLADLGRGAVAAQGLLEPVVVRRDPADVRLLGDAATLLAELGVVLEAFGEDALLVRAVPAPLRACIEQPDVADLVDRLMPWVRLHAADRDALRRHSVDALASTVGTDPAPRLCRKWLAELEAEGVELASVPGIRRFTAAELLR